MRAPLRTELKKLSCLAVTLITLWLSGFGCSLCCSTGAGNHCCTGKTTSCSSSSEVEADCCKSEKKHCAASASFSVSNLTDPTCSLLPSQMPGEFNRLSATNLVAAVVPVIHFSPPSEMDKHTLVFTGPALPANRGSTYLRCCVFLI
jgi:hypothetical protein